MGDGLIVPRYGQKHSSPASSCAASAARGGWGGHKHGLIIALCQALKLKQLVEMRRYRQTSRYWALSPHCNGRCLV